MSILLGNKDIMFNIGMAYRCLLLCIFRISSPKPSGRPQMNSDFQQVTLVSRVPDVGF